MSLTANSVPHPRLELIFTIDEERGIVGARKLDPALLDLSAKLFLNLDTEEYGEICIASAGSLRMDLQKECVTKPARFPQYTLSLT